MALLRGTNPEITTMFYRSWRLLALVSIFAALGLSKIAPAQSYPPAWKDTSSYAVGDQVQLNGNVLRCTHAVSPGGFRYDDWELWEVRANTVLMIGTGQTFSTFPLAWQYAENARIAQGAYLHFYISTAKGTHSETINNPIFLNHPFGASMQIIGDNASKINFTFPTQNGLELTENHTFGGITGLTLTGNGSSSGISASDNSVIDYVVSTTITGFDTGVLASTGAEILLDGTCKIQNFSIGVFATTESRIICAGANLTLDGAGTASCCAEESYGGFLSMSGATLENATYGLYATEDGHVEMPSALISGTSHGIAAQYGVHVNFEFGTINNSSMNGIMAVNGAIVDAFMANENGASNSVGTSDGSYIYM